MIGGFDVRGSELGNVSSIGTYDRRVVTRLVELESEMVSVAYVEHRDEDRGDAFYVYQNVFNPYAPTIQIEYSLDEYEEFPSVFFGDMVYLKSFIAMIDWGTQLDV